jgi:hypothetical protein
MQATTNVQIPLRVLAGDEVTSYYGLARIYDISGTLITSVSLTHITEGLYGGLYTPTVEGVYTIVFQLYTDSGHTTPSMLSKGTETLDVSSYRTNIMRILGLVHENSVVDLNTYDTDGNLLSARVRTYNSAVNAAAALAASPSPYATGLQFEYAVSASFSSSLLKTYSITRVT